MIPYKSDLKNLNLFDRVNATKFLFCEKIARLKVFYLLFFR
jgi:hypothetical protein